jgi:hypothetical protein
MGTHDGHKLRGAREDRAQRRVEDEAGARRSPTGLVEALQLLADHSERVAGPRTIQRLADHSGQVHQLTALQLDADAYAASEHGREGGELHRVAEAGVSGAGSPLPHLDTIQRAFGRHDLSHVRAFTGGAARQAGEQLRARAYATGSKVAFNQAPSLRTAAHEAAHIIQQQTGVQLEGGVGKVGDVYERHADTVADRVIAGRSAEDVLDRYAPPGSNSSSVQAKAVQCLPVVQEITKDEEKAISEYKGDNYKYFNWFLRGQQLTTRKVVDYGNNQVPALTSALTKMHASGNYDYNGALYRGDVFSVYSDADQAIMDDRGSTLTVASFMSTSKTKATAEAYGQDLWKVSSNMNGIDIHRAGIGQDNEGEVLFPAGSRFRIDTARRKIGMPKLQGNRKRKITVSQTG